MPRKKTPPSRRLTIYLLNAEVTEFSQALVADASYGTIDLAADVGIDGVFHYEARAPRPAAWAGYVQPALASELAGVFTASSSGLLLLRVEQRIFAVVFGFGKALLDLEAVVRRFGLRVTLNRVAPTSLRSLDTKTLDDMVVSKRTQTSRMAELPAFGVDASRDLLRAATGKPADPTFATSLSGADALVIASPTEVAQLPAKCAELLRAYDEVGYKEQFGWVDQLTPVESKSRIAALDLRLVDALKAGDLSSVHMAPPDPLPWDEVDGFAFKVGGAGSTVYEDLDLEDYLRDLQDVDDLTTSLLRTRRVRVQWARTGEFEDKWSVHRCIVAEFRDGDSLYVLTEGEWFQVAQSLVEKLDGFLSTVEGSSYPFPRAAKGQAEASYNKLLAPATSDTAILLDVKLPRPGGANSGIEPCDVLSTDGEFIHVKRKARSSTLSHLFSQGSVAIAALHEDEAYRANVRKAIGERALGRDPAPWLALVPSDWGAGFAANLKVTYAIVAEGNDDDYNWLPFFSRLNLMQHARTIGLIGAKVGVVRIPV